MLLSVAIRGGLFHPNCRHTMGLYIDGFTKIPPPIPAEQMQRQRELEARQRAMERKIRKLKRLEAGTQDPQVVKEYGRKLKQAQQEMKTFVDENHDVLRRDYEREKVYGGEDNKSQYMSMRRIDWSKATPTHHEQKEYDDICEYAKQKGINIYNVNAFDGDMDILKEQIDMISSMKNEYAINKKITISFKDMYDEDFAETVKNTIYFNKKALRNRKITNEILNADNALAATDIRGIAVHEMGHIISHQYGEKGLDIARKAYYNVHKKEITNSELINYLSSEISDYSVFSQALQRKKRFKEITPEVLSKSITNPSVFSLEYSNLLRKECCS